MGNPCLVRRPVWSGGNLTVHAVVHTDGLCDTCREPDFLGSFRLSSIQGGIWRWSFSDFVLASHLQSQGLWTIGQSTTAIPLRTVLQLCLWISQETWGPGPVQDGCKCSPCQIPLLHVHRNPPLRGGRWRGGITAPGKE